jgi:hypothetical protein
MANKKSASLIVRLALFIYPVKLALIFQPEHSILKVFKHFQNISTEQYRIMENLIF